MSGLGHLYMEVTFNTPLSLLIIQDPHSLYRTTRRPAHILTLSFSGPTFQPIQQVEPFKAWKPQHNQQQAPLSP